MAKCFKPSFFHEFVDIASPWGILPCKYLLSVPGVENTTGVECSYNSVASEPAFARSSTQAESAGELAVGPSDQTEAAPAADAVMEASAVPGDERAHQLSYPVVLYLTGKGEMRWADRVADWDGSQKLDPVVFQRFIVIVPLISQDSALFENNNNVNPDALWLLVRVALNRLGPVADCQRLSILGYSLGADSALKLGVRYGSCISSLGLFCGLYDFLPSSPDVEAKANLNGVSIRFFHALGDHYVPVQHTRKAFAFMTACLDTTETQREVVVDEPEPPSWDPFAQVEMDVHDCNTGSCSMWLVRDYVYRQNDSWQGWRQPRRHVFWPMILCNESTFGVFKWLGSNRRSTRVVPNAIFDVVLKRDVLCLCSKLPPPTGKVPPVPPCPAATLGFSIGIPASKGKGGIVEEAGAPAGLVVGPGFHFDGPATPWRRWNRHQLAAGRQDQQLLSGDLILQVNETKLDMRVMASQLWDPTCPHLRLCVLRPAGLEVAFSVTAMPLGNTGSPLEHCESREAHKRPREDSQEQLWERQLRGHFATGPSDGGCSPRAARAAKRDMADKGDGVVAALDAPCAEHPSNEREKLLGSRKFCEAACIELLAREYHALQARLRSTPRIELEALMQEPERQWKRSWKADAWLGLLATAEALKESSGFLALLASSPHAVRELLASFLGGPVPILVPPANAPVLKLLARLARARASLSTEPVQDWICSDDVRRELLLAAGAPVEKKQGSSAETPCKSMTATGEGRHEQMAVEKEAATGEMNTVCQDAQVSDSQEPTPV